MLVHNPTEESNRIFIKCPHDVYRWKYTGHMQFYATCPSCRRNVKIRQNQIKEEEPV
jgi:hypothetical protein